MRSLLHFPSPPPPSFTQSPSPRSLVRDGQPSPHRPRLVVARSTCPPISPPPPPRKQLCTRSCSNKHTHAVVSSGREASEKKRAEARRGQGQCWGEARLVMERASFSLGWQTPARRSTLIPSTPLRGTPRAADLRSFYISLVNTVCVVPCSRTTYLAPIPSFPQPSTVTLVRRALAMKCSLG
jgi:hypothetical protein